MHPFSLTLHLFLGRNAKILNELSTLGMSVTVFKTHACFQLGSFSFVFNQITSYHILACMHGQVRARGKFEKYECGELSGKEGWMDGWICVFDIWYLVFLEIGWMEGRDGG